jgi:hypothetical protein
VHFPKNLLDRGLDRSHNLGTHRLANVKSTALDADHDKAYRQTVQRLRKAQTFHQAEAVR